MSRSQPPRRSVRRHHAARRKAWVTRALSHYFLATPDIEPRRVGMYARTPKPCSCWMCGNPRRHHGEPTLRERRERGRGWRNEASDE